MINSELKVEKREAQEMTPLPENIYQVQLLDIDDEKRPTYDTRNKPDEEKEYETVLNFQFVLLAGKDKEGKDARGRSLWANFIPTYLYISKKNGKNKLYQITEALLGRELTPEDEAKMDGAFLNGLIGNQCRVGTKNKTNDNGTFTNIDVYYSADAELEKLSDEEKEKATPKKKDDNPSVDEVQSDEISPEDIPFD